MQHSNNAAISNQTNWDLKFFKRELSDLHRERCHLLRKSQERSLSSWEEERLLRVVDEVTELLERLAELGSAEISLVTKTEA